MTAASHARCLRYLFTRLQSLVHWEQGPRMGKVEMYCFSLLRLCRHRFCPLPRRLCELFYRLHSPCVLAPQMAGTSACECGDFSPGTALGTYKLSSRPSALLCGVDPSRTLSRRAVPSARTWWNCAKPHLSEAQAEGYCPSIAEGTFLSCMSRSLCSRNNVL